MHKIFLVIVITLVLVFGLRYCEHQKDNREQLVANTALIEKQLKNVGKLIVTEGSYSQIYTYNDTKKLMMGMVDSKKKAIVIVNAEASMSHDLSKVTSEIVTESKTLRITFILESELKINPNIEYCDVTADIWNPFEAEDYNLVKTA
ncbi:MAG: hypothetical protein ACI9Y7_002259 [Dokdonia sp.]|jgi:uncharacterized protein YpmB